MDYIENRNCIICGSANYKIIHKEGEHQYAICKDCSHVFQTNRKASAEYHKLPYESQWDDYLNHSSKRAKYISEFCGDWINSIRSAIDIGCGPGGVVKALQKEFPEAKIEGLTSPLDKDRVLEGFDITFCDFEDEEYDLQKDYDLAVLSHVLEHFNDPMWALRKIYEAQEMCGVIYIEVPSFNWAEVRSNPQFCPVHLSYFSKGYLKKLLELCGYRVLKIHESKYWGNIKVVAAKLGKPKRSSDIPWQIKLLHWKFNRIFLHPIYKLIRRFKTIKAND